jgi:hypothetical protein
LNFFQSKFISIFKYVGWIKYLPTYIPTFSSRLNIYLDRTYLDQKVSRQVKEVGS